MSSHEHIRALLRKKFNSKRVNQGNTGRDKVKVLSKILFLEFDKIKIIISY